MLGVNSFITVFFGYFWPKICSNEIKQPKNCISYIFAKLNFWLMQIFKSCIRQGPSVMLNINDFISGILTVISLFSFATSNLIRHEKIGTKELQAAMKWGSLVSSSFLVFSVQLGVQTMPNLLSGVLFPADDRSTLKGITRSIQCILLVIVLKVWTLIKRSIFQTFWKTHSCTIFLFFKLETSNFGCLLILNFP